jgi:hypothetical protein
MGGNSCVAGEKVPDVRDRVVMPGSTTLFADSTATQ